MQQLMRWEPFNDADEFFKSFLRPSHASDADRRPEWMPAVDIRETESEYTVMAEMPGIRREDVKVRVEDDVLTLEGERRQEKEAKGERSHRVERLYGHFSRRFTLPEDAEAEKIAADCKEGIVTVHIPKRPVEKRSTREIAVQ
jgi:HSP20 family protein